MWMEEGNQDVDVYKKEIVWEKKLQEKLIEIKEEKKDVKEENFKQIIE